MKTQTVVEYLISELPSIDWENSYWQSRLEKAKEMEKHQKGYSEEEVLDLVENFEIHLGSVKVEEMLTFKKWFKQRLNSKLDKTFIPKEIDMLELGQIIPKEEEEPKQDFSDKNYTPELELLGKQETLEETNKSLLDIRAEILNSYSSGIKTIGEIDLLLNQYVEIINKERNYSEDEVLNLLVKINYCPTTLEGRIEVKNWFEQHKNKL